MVDADTIASQLLARADDHSAAVRSVDGGCWTWAQVVAESAGRASALEARDLTGRHVGVLLDNVPEFVFLVGAAALSGTTVVALNPTRRGAELARDVSHTLCSTVFSTARGARLLAEAGAATDVVRVDDDCWHHHIDAAPPAVAAGVDAETQFMLIFTSGSTGAPKAVRLSQGRALRSGRSAGIAFTGDDVLYCSMPLFHSNALVTCLFAAVATGASVVLRPRFSASNFMTDVRTFDCTFFNYVGRTLSYVLAQPPTESDRDHRLKFCFGSEASVRDRREFRRRFGCPVIEGYSSSEGVVTIRPVSGMPAGALGKPDDEDDVAVVDPTSGRECPRARMGPDGQLLNPEAVGEIVGRAHADSFEGYFANDDAEHARVHDGWYWTGDLGYRDADGVFYFAGRNSDWMRVDGENLAAGPIEAVLERAPGVRAAVVYGVPDPISGDRVMAAVEADDDFDPTTLGDFLAAQSDMGTKSAPSFVRVVDAIPSTTTGKVDRKPLQAQRWNTTDPLWWRRGPDPDYRPMTAADIAALDEETR